MPVLTNKALGVTVSVSEAVAAGLGSQWVSAEKREPEKPAPRRRASKSDD